MKRYNIIVACLLTLLAGMTGCGDNFDVSDKYNGVLSLSTPGYSLVETYDVGVAHTENIYFQRGGLNFTPSTICLSIDEELIDSMNIAAGTAYRLMPQEYYAIESTSIRVDSEERLIAGKITVDPAKLLELNGGLYGALDYVVPLRMSTQGMSSVAGRNTLILGFSVTEATVGIANTSDEAIDLETTDVLKFPVEVPFENQWNMIIKTEVDEAYVDEYNEANGTFYGLLPEAYYTTTGQAEMAEGASSVNIEYTLNKEAILPGNYILPVKISAVETDVNMSFDLDAHKVFIITKAGAELDRSGWTIAYCTTQETVGDPGQAENMIDNNTSSFWHSRWKGGNDPLPYNIVIDTKKQTTPSQLQMLVRNNASNQIKLVRFYMGNDFTDVEHTEWEFIGEFSCNVSTSYFTYAVKQASGRYLRFEVPDAGGNGTVAAICDLKVMGTAQ